MTIIERSPMSAHLRVASLGAAILVTLIGGSASATGGATISDTATFPAQNSFVGPVKDASDDFYVVLLDKADTSIVRMFKASDPAGRWSEADPEARLDLPAAVLSMWSVLDGSVIHVATQDANRDVEYHTFNTSSAASSPDTWQTVREVVDGTPNGTAAAVSIAVRSDGSVIVLYQGATDDVGGTSYERVDYARKESGVWTTGVSIDNGGANHWKAAVIVNGSSDHLHLFFKNDSTSDYFQRTLRSDNTLENFPAAFEFEGVSSDYPFGSGVAYEDEGAISVRVPYVEARSGGRAFIATLDSADSPTVTTEQAGDHEVRTAGPGRGISLAVIGMTMHLVYVAAVDGDIYHDSDNGSGWGVDETIVEDDVHDLSAAAYVRGMNRLAIMHDSGNRSSVRYQELDLNPPIALAGHVRSLVDQDIGPFGRAWPECEASAAEPAGTISAAVLCVADASASVGELKIVPLASGIAAPSITATGLSSSVSGGGSCAATTTGGAVGTLSIGDTSVPILGTPNQVISLPGDVGTIALNQVTCIGGITTRRALHLSMTLGEQTLEIIAAESSAA